MKTDVHDFGAIGDGVSLDTSAINSAIEGCAAAGGGQVTLSPGSYLSGTVKMKSGVTLYVAAGARLIGTPDLDQYSGPPRNGKHSRWHRGLITLDDVHDVCICGPGVIDGNKVFDPQGEEKMRGPHTILSANSSRIRIADLNIVDAANYAMMMTVCDDVDVNNVTVNGGWDGFHIRGVKGRHSQRATVTNSRFFTGDDCIAGCYTDDLLVNNCVLNTSCNGIRWIGPGRRLHFHNLTIFGKGRHPHRTSGRTTMLAGITVQPGAWGAMPGPLDDVRIDNVSTHNVSCPLWLVVKNEGTMGRVDISRVTASGTLVAAMAIESWVDAPIGEVSLRDCDFAYAHPPVLDVESNDTGMPSFDVRPLPAWGLYARNVAKLTLDNVRLDGPAEDVRPAILEEMVQVSRRRDVKLPMD